MQRDDWVVAEIDKDLAKFPVDQIEKHIQKHLAHD
jgi:protein required for attachment to host cells